ncbi:MAG TPA: PDZ domain-containing protein, partial [Flavisolibacter sp.]|nr:PDZ domain-containing protein [Flavisolibacter sp.]
DSTGTGPSDHTSFYQKNIPVLFYFTGVHSDYHKPTDDANKINLNGEAAVVQHVFSLLQAAGKVQGKFPFTKTRDPQTMAGRFSVTLGIMPDYTFSGTGIRVDAVSEGRAAQKAGLQEGDVITALGDFTVNSMESYMQALSQFKKGDKTTVRYTRDGKTLVTTAEFQ